ncbi:pentatricopeptide repeat-containing protein At2g21090-like [Lolium perenne]|uniref:pentatricopeptide repeat-containing protein At2g21090-like n=1 Tax=Lolium perenne TaxID=4522 RepID=UPI0021EB3D5A|nr:pentatricopeptide repeat-containing protein At2g21090-like [Lolium perenne]
MSIARRSPSPTSPPYSGLLGALHCSVSGGQAAAAVSLLPTLSRAGLRPPFPLLCSLARLLLLRRAAPSFPTLAGRLLLYIRLAGLKHLVASSTPLANQLLSLHLLLGRPRDARRLFARMPQPTVYSYNAMLTGYAHLALAAPAANLFAAMPHRDLTSYNAAMLALASGGEMREGVALYSELRHTSPPLGYNHQTFSALLVACASLMDGELARQLHAHLSLLGFLSDINISSALIDVYRKCGRITDAHSLFNEVPAKDMRMWTSVVCGYAEDGQLTAARRLFDQMQEKSILSWNALMEGYVRHGQAVEALNIFQQLIKDGFHPDQLTFSSALSACAAIGSITRGKQIHGRLLQTGFDPNVIIPSSLIEMYSKCGYLAGARQIFDLTCQDRRDIALWNAMLSALCHHGLGQEAVGLFVQMIREKLKPDAISFLLVLTVCSHCGLVDEGMNFFELMIKRYRIVPGEDHHACMVDLISRSSRSCDEVVDWIRSSPFGCSKQALETLVGKCAINGNTELMSKIEEHLAELDSPK